MLKYNRKYIKDHINEEEIHNFLGISEEDREKIIKFLNNTIVSIKAEIFCYRFGLTDGKTHSVDEVIQKYHTTINTVLQCTARCIRALKISRDSMLIHACDIFYKSTDNDVCKDINFEV